MSMQDTARLVQLAVIELIALILSIAVHEFGHAFVADKLGDPLPRAQGRVTLNPLAHIDPIGTILFPLLGFWASYSGSSLSGRILGWGKPVQWSGHARYITRKVTMKTAALLISVAGPAMNVLFAIVLSGLYLVLRRAGMAEFDLERHVLLFPGHVGSVIAMNLGLAMFNLIPIPPLDGRSILFWFLPDSHPVVQFLSRYGQYIFLGLLVTGAFRFVSIPILYVGDLWLGQLSAWAG